MRSQAATPPGRAIRAALVPVVLALALVTVASAESERALSKSSCLVALPALTGNQESYANTPEELSPFNKFANPHIRFFQPKQFFLPKTFDDEMDPGGEIRIGVMAYDASSPFARLSSQLERGCEFALDEANARGGTRGLKYRLMIERTLPVWGASSNAAVNLAYRHKVVAFVGPTDPADSHIALRVTLKTNVPMISTACTDSTQTETRIPWYLRCCVDDRQYAYALATQVVKQMGIERIGVMRVNAMYGRFGIVEFIDACRRLGRPVVTEMRFKQGAREFAQQLEHLEQAKLGVLVLWADAEDAAHFVKAARARGLTMPILGSDRLVDPRFLEIAGKDAEGIISVTDYDPTRKDVELGRFQRAWAKRYGEPPGQVAARTYAGVRILIDAIERAGPYRHAVQDEMLKLEGRTVQTILGPIPFDSRLDNMMPAVYVRVKDGRFEYLGTRPFPR